MWVSLDPNDLPIPHELLHPEGRNQLALVFEDTSRDSKPAGVIHTMKLRYNREGQSWSASGWALIPGLRQRVTVEP
jgi:hypothetical protein